MDRLIAARERVRQVKAELASPAVAFPCINCRYYEITCAHPAASEIKASPITGRVTATQIAADKVRSENGACGPEGALFDRRTPFGLAVVSIVCWPGTWWLAAFAAAALLDRLLV